MELQSRNRRVERDRRGALVGQVQLIITQIFNGGGHYGRLEAVDTDFRESTRGRNQPFDRERLPSRAGRRNARSRVGNGAIRRRCRGVVSQPRGSASSARSYAYLGECERSDVTSRQDSHWGLPGGGSGVRVSGLPV